jgi:hypothetical protein
VETVKIPLVGLGNMTNVFFCKAIVEQYCSEINYLLLRLLDLQLSIEIPILNIMYFLDLMLQENKKSLATKSVPVHCDPTQLYNRFLWYLEFYHCVPIWVGTYNTQDCPKFVEYSKHEIISQLSSKSQAV